MTGWCSTGSCRSSALGSLGGTCPSGTDRGPVSIPVSAGGRRTARSSGCSRPRKRRPTRAVTSTGWYRSTPPSSAPTSTPPEPEKGGPGPALGRSRGGLTSKIHLACDGLGRPLAFALTGGSTNDCTQFTAVMDTIRVPRIGPGRRRIRPDHVIGDKGHSSKAIRTWLRRRASRTPSPSGPIRSRTASDGEAPAATRRRSTGICTSGATWWSGASTG